MPVYSNSNKIAMNITIENNELVIRAPIDSTPKQTSTGKSLLLVNSGGWITANATHQGKTVKVNVTAIIPVK